MEYNVTKATSELLERVWARDIARNPGDSRWLRWREQYLAYNASGMAVTYAVTADGEPVGQGTLLLSPDCSAIDGRLDIADGVTVANVNALRIEKPHEGKGLISQLVRLLENEASSRGFSRVTIGVEAHETRNLAIYLHWGYRELVRYGEEDGELVLYYGKELSNG